MAHPERLRQLVEANPAASDIFIDEVQRVPELLALVHQLIERPNSPRILLTASSTRTLQRAGVDLLAGRATHRTMHPFMAAELGSRLSLDSAPEVGLLPIVWDSRDDSDPLSSYVGLYVQHELQAERFVLNIGAFYRFLEAISLAHGASLNVSEVAQECAVSRKTVEG